MKKVWIYKRKNILGWWVGWYESGNRKAKALPSKELAEHFKYIKYTQLNSDVFTGIVVADWRQMNTGKQKRSRESQKEHFMKLHCLCETLSDWWENAAQSKSLKVPSTSSYCKEGLK